MEIHTTFQQAHLKLSTIQIRKVLKSNLQPIIVRLLQVQQPFAGMAHIALAEIEEEHAHIMAALHVGCKGAFKYLPLTGWYMQLPSASNVKLVCGDNYLFAGHPPVTYGVSGKGVMVFALPENTVIKMKFCGRQTRGQKHMPSRGCGNYTLRRTLEPMP